MKKQQKLHGNTACAGLCLAFALLATVPLNAQESHAGHGTTPTAPAQKAGPAPAAGAQTLQQLNTILQRMMADPVIRERVATDPALQRMLQTAGLLNMQGMQGMPGMEHGGMEMGSAATRKDQEDAMQFIVRLLGDPSVAQRIEEDSKLRRLWLDPEVQRRVAELRKVQGEVRVNK